MNPCVIVQLLWGNVNLSYSSGGLVRTFPQHLDENNITSYRQESVIQRIHVPRVRALDAGVTSLCGLCARELPQPTGT
jgi:hypothetical protein